ncbi:hypothetical protein BD410DRAFT_836171 [Rickenella mellea]|uniref:NAD(P)-binding protein n=1 Tax=Rickenella mellea TaxID=50990 RepID=A0A4Y7QIA3_9AGAM|nr:hypothetical protein BD410DRAFT_836171 [Rickenella mellea]
MLHAVRQVYRESFPPKPTFSVDDIPDLSGKVMIVTGSNAGVGKETVKALLQRNAKVVKSNHCEGGDILELDLANLKSVKQAAEEFIRGVMAPPIKDLTSDGYYDLQFGTNVLGHFYFTKLLPPTLISTSAHHSSDGKVRILTTSSSTHLFGAIERALTSLILFPAPYGALTQLWAGTTSGGASLNGKYLIPWARVGEAKKECYDPEIGKKLWAWLDEQVKDL